MSTTSAGLGLGVLLGVGVAGGVVNGVVAGVVAGVAGTTTGGLVERIFFTESLTSGIAFVAFPALLAAACTGRAFMTSVVSYSLSWTNESV